MKTRGGSKPGERRGGRQKGTANKLTLAVKQVFEQVAVELGGVQRMVAWAKEDAANERIFWGTIYPKLLPFQVAGADGTPASPRRVIIELDDARS